MTEPLVLLHGIGSHRQVWDPVLGLLGERFEVAPLDLPGFGEAPPLEGEEPTPQALARAIARELDARGWETAHVAGNSLGGWVALELAKLGRTRSVCALSPAGFWRGWERAYCAASLRVGRAAARATLGQSERTYRSAAVRRAAFAQFVVHGDRMPVADAVAASRNLALSPGWEPTLRAMIAREFDGGAQVRGPVTVAWAEHDRLLLLRQAARARAALPAARHLLLAGCGHVPIPDDPEQVAQAIVTST